MIRIGDSTLRIPISVRTHPILSDICVVYDRLSYPWKSADMRTGAKETPLLKADHSAPGATAATFLFKEVISSK